MAVAGTVLDRLEANLFEMPYASDGKVRGVFSYARKMPKLAALKKPNIQINGPRRIAYLAFDIDRDIGALAWEDANLPPPNLVVINPRNGHAHLIYELRDPVWLPKKDTQSANPKPIRFLKAAQKAMATALGADPQYTGLLVNNPLHACWRVFSWRSEPYSLNELTSHLEFAEETYPRRFRAQQDLLSGLVTGSRYVTLFEIVRRLSYKMVRYYTSLADFKTAINTELDYYNSLCDVPLPQIEIRDLCKKISKWTWEKLHAKRRCKIDVSDSDTITDKQRKAQQWTSATRVEKSIKRIAAAIDLVRGTGKRVSKSAVAVVAQLDRKTVSRHWDKALAVTSPVTLPNSSPDTHSSLLRETEGLRPKSCGPCGAEAASPQGGDTVCDSQVPTPGGEFAALVSQHENRTLGLLRALQKASELAKQGILMSGVPRSYAHTLVPLIEAVTGQPPDIGKLPPRYSTSYILRRDEHQKFRKLLN